MLGINVRLRFDMFVYVKLGMNLDMNFDEVLGVNFECECSV